MSAETAFFIATPAPLAVTEVTPTSLTVRWHEDNPLAIQYRLEGRDPGGAWSELETIYRGEGLTPSGDYLYTENGLRPETARCYQYLVIGATTPWPTSNEVCATTEVAPSQSMPTL